MASFDLSSFKGVYLKVVGGGVEKGQSFSLHINRSSAYFQERKTDDDSNHLDLKDIKSKGKLYFSARHKWGTSVFVKSHDDGLIIEVNDDEVSEWRLTG